MHSLHWRINSRQQRPEVRLRGLPYRRESADEGRLRVLVGARSASTAAIFPLPASTNARTRAMSFRTGSPGKLVPVFESTPHGRAVRIAAATFAGVRPPART